VCAHTHTHVQGICSTPVADKMHTCTFYTHTYTKYIRIKHTHKHTYVQGICFTPVVDKMHTCTFYTHTYNKYIRIKHAHAHTHMCRGSASHLKQTKCTHAHTYILTRAHTHAGNLLHTCIRQQRRRDSCNGMRGQANPLMAHTVNCRVLDRTV
jgi:hypothetical protein